VTDNLEGRVDRIEHNLARLSELTLIIAERLDNVAKRHDELDKRFEDRMQQITLKHLEIDEALTALIHTVDEWIRGNPRNGAGT
jgi:hypothetical protein